MVQAWISNSHSLVPDFDRSGCQTSSVKPGLKKESSLLCGCAGIFIIFFSRRAGEGKILEVLKSVVYRFAGLLP